MAVLGRGQPLQAIIEQGTGIRPGSLIDVEDNQPDRKFYKTFQAIIEQGTGVAFNPGVAPNPIVISPVTKIPPTEAIVSQGTAVPVVPAPVVVYPVTKISPAPPIVEQGTAAPVIGVPVVEALLPPRPLAPLPIITRGTAAAPVTPGLAPPPILVARPTVLPRTVPPIALGSHVGIVPPPPPVTPGDLDVCIQGSVTSWIMGDVFTDTCEAGAPITNWFVGTSFTDCESPIVGTNWIMQAPVEDC